MIQIENTFKTSVATCNVVFFSQLALPFRIAVFSKKINFSFQDQTIEITKILSFDLNFSIFLSISFIDDGSDL